MEIKMSARDWINSIVNESMRNWLIDRIDPQASNENLYDNVADAVKVNVNYVGKDEEKIFWEIIEGNIEM